MKPIWLIPTILLGACNGDETVSAYLNDTSVFALKTLNDAPFTAQATIDLSEPGRVTGAAPCNRYFADQTAPYPWFDVGPIGATRRACEDLPSETQYFQALERMTIVEVTGDTLILSNTEDEEMVFEAD